MVRTGKKYVGALPAKLILLLVLAAVILLGYSTAIQAADNDTFFDPFTLTGFSIYLTSDSDEEGPNPNANPRAHIMVPYRGWKRSPHKPPWPPDKE